MSNQHGVNRSAAKAVATAWAVLLSLGAASAHAAEAAPAVDTGDTAWVLTASALVLMMTLPGLALFYGGLVRAKNILNVLMQCFISAGIVGVLWIVVGYSLAFGTGNAWIGDLSKVGLANVSMDSVTANFASPPRNIPEYLFIMFQAMFAIITPALILGAIAERMKFSAWVAFLTIWLLVVYCPIAHMVWGAEGWIFKSGAIDFAGGLVVHMSSGFSAIVAAIMLGKRRGFGMSRCPRTACRSA
jgi:Amt family ammonium transporter